MGKNITNTVSVPLHLILLRIKRWLIYPEFLLPLIYYCSVAWVLSNSLWSYELQHARCPSPHSWSLPKFMSFASVMPSGHLILWCPLLLLPSIFPSIRDFSNESAVHIRWPKYWSFSFSISPSNKYSGFISLTIDWLDSLAVQGAFRSLIQHHSWKASILSLSAFFLVQFSQLYMTTGKTIALTIWTFVSRVMSLLFNTLSRFVILSCQEAIVFWFHGQYLQWF